MIKRYNNIFIYVYGTSWQVSSQEHPLAPQGRTMYVPQGRPIPASQTDLWYQMAGSGSHERVAAPRGYEGDAMKRGTQDVATLRLTGFLIAVLGLPGMLSPGTKSSNLGMARPGGAGSGVATS